MSFRDWFQRRFGAPFPIPLEVGLEKKGDAFWSTPEYSGSAPMVPSFDEELERYVLAGEWGRGVNTYAFYFVEKRGPHRRFFRIFSGGVYGSAGDAAKEVIAFLSGYEAWRSSAEAKLAGSTLIHNLDVTEAELVLPGGEIQTLARADEGAHFWLQLAAVS